MIDLSLLRFLPEELRVRISDQMLDIILARALERAELLLSPELRPTFRDLLSPDRTDEEIMAFLQRELPQLPQILVEEAFRLRQEVSARD